MYKVTIEVSYHTKDGDRYIVKVETLSKKWWNKLFKITDIYTVKKVNRNKNSVYGDIGMPVATDLVFESPQHAKDFIVGVIPTYERWIEYLQKLLLKHDEIFKQYHYTETVIDVK